MTALDIAQWLQAQGLARYEQAFRDNDVDGEVLALLDDADLERLGVSLGHRKKLLRAIAALAATGTSAEKTFPSGEGVASAEIAGERRQVTVLFADLAGYTRLTHELGAEAMHDITDRFFGLADGVIERFGGTIDKHIGDCVMAVFGAPVAHGNDPERAVRAALAIRDAMPDLGRALGCELSTHIGIASGQVVASSGAGHKTYSITGDSVNLASRLTDQAAPGTILASEAVHRPLADRLECAELGALDVKGFSPVRAFRVIGLRDTGQADRPFVGRRAELRQLESVLDACIAHRRGQAVHIRGEAGIGKSRLVEELQGQATDAGFACHKGLVLDFGAGAGQDAIGALVRSLLGLGATGDHAAVVAAAEAAVRDELMTPERRVFLNDLLNLAQPTALRALYDAMDNQARHRGRQDTVAELILRTSLQKPRLIIVEDVHWADGPTLDFLARLIATVGDARAVLVMTSRLEGDPLDLWRSRTGGNPLLTLDLGPLRDDEAHALAEAYVDASTELARRCVARAAGNPLFLDQLLRHAEENAEGGVPGSVQSLVQARLDLLPAEDRQALQAASVLGQRFAPEALGHLLDRSIYDCTQLARHLLVRPIGDELLFGHALIRDGVYDSLLGKRRVALHLRAAQWFAARDPALHAEHLERAHDPGAPDAYLAAARAQIATYRYDVALDLAERGLAIGRTEEQIFALTCLRGEILHDLGAMADASDAYGAALAAASDDAQRCRAWLGLAAVKRVTDDLDGAFADLERAEAAARAENQDEQLARVHFLRGNLHFPRGDLQGCLDQHSRSLACAQAAGAADLEAAALGGLGDAEYARGRMITAHERFRACVELCRRHGFGRIEVANASMLGHSGLYFQPQADALAVALAAADGAARVGHRRAELNARLAVIFALYELAEFHQVADQAERASALASALGAARFDQPCLLYLGKVALAEDRRADAIELLSRSLTVARATSVGFHGPTICGALALALEDPAQRREMLSEGEAMLARGSVAHNHLRFYPDAMTTALELGNGEAFERYAAALEGFTRAEPLPWAEFFIARGRALAAFRHEPHRPDVAAALEHARTQARELGCLTALPALDAALAVAAREA